MLILLLLAMGFPTLASAYVDPGTTSSVFGLVASIVSGAGVLAAFLIRPVLRVFHGKKTSDASHSAATDIPDSKNEKPPTPPVV